MPEFFDIACNFSHKSFLHRLDEVIASAKSCGVKKFAVISANIDDIDIVRDLKLQYEEICASTAGVHPHHASELMSWTHQDLKEIISNLRVGLQKAEKDLGTREKLKKRIAALSKISRSELQHLKGLNQKLRDSRARQEAMSTGIKLLQSNQLIRLNGQELRPGE